MVVQWLGLGTFNVVAWVQSLVGDTKIPKAVQHSQKKRHREKLAFKIWMNLFFFFEFSQSINPHYFHFQLLFLNIYLIYSWLRWVFATARSPAARRCCYRGSEWRLLKVWSSRLSLPWPFSLQSRAPGCSGFIS